MISIALATYNSEKYIIKQLDSISHQTLLPDEIIISDDCSKDNTINIIENFKKEHENLNISIFKNISNSGYVKNFSNAISHCSGDFIFLCDHDDEWIDIKVESMVSLLNKNKKIQALASSFNKIDGKGNKIKVNTSLFSSNDGLYKYPLKKDSLVRVSFEKEFTYNVSPGCCIVFRVEIKNRVLDALNFAPHDYLISALAASDKGLYFYNHSLINYRIHEGNKIGLPENEDYRLRLKIIQNDYKSKLDIFNNIESELCYKDKKYAKKHLEVLKSREEYFSKKNSKGLFLLVIKSLFMKKFFLSILKDIKVLRGKSYD